MRLWVNKQWRTRRRTVLLYLLLKGNLWYISNTSNIFAYHIWPIISFWTKTTDVWKELATKMSVEVIFIIDENLWKVKRLMIEDWLNKLWFMQWKSLDIKKKIKKKRYGHSNHIGRLININYKCVIVFFVLNRCIYKSGHGLSIYVPPNSSVEI